MKTKMKKGYMVCKFCKCLTFLVDERKDDDDTIIRNDEGYGFSQTNNDYTLAFLTEEKNLLGVLKKDMTYLMLDIKLGCLYITLML